MRCYISNIPAMADTLRIRLHVDDKRKAMEAARREGVPMSVWLRRVIDQAAQDKAA